ncbi:MAG TPA: adenylate/guanylate cyclase domain-containing protein, partial [Gemmatimonadota bacterium]|nr:adenylate/guanylate cyclase domain-containing protein [Gemmatimonadota bacterium]
AQLRGDRREVVVLFADLKGYTALSEKLDPEDVTLLMNMLLQRLAGAVYDYEGYVDKFIGDSVMALFGAPLAHENDAERAVLAGLAMLDVMADHNAGAETPLALRVGIHLGEVVAAHLGSEMQLQYTVLGDTVNVASRLESAAEPNTVLVSEAVQDRVQDRFEEVELPPLTLKGKSEPVRAFRIVRYTGGGVSPARPWSPFAGRHEELSRLRAFLERTTIPAGTLVVEGDAGNGKSRLVAESLADSRLRTLTVAFSQIRLPGQRAPEVELFDYLAGQGEGTAEERARDLLGPAFETHRRGIEGLLREVHGDGSEARPSGEDPQAARQNRWLALTALLQAAARRSRLVLLFEDIHWADETARELLGFLVPAATERGIPVLMTTRPVAEPAPFAEVERLMIGPLDEAAAEALVRGRLEELAPEDRRELIRRSQGNPLFLEELMRDWEDAGAEARRSVPGTVQGLIKSRIDRLEPPLQLLLQMAAVLGTHFPTRLLSRMYALESQPIGFDPAVTALQERGFLEERSPEERGFRHALMQEVAYGGLLQSVRNVLHESAARIGEEFFADRRDLEAEFFAHHYWSAGLSDAALPHLWSAGRAAFSRYDLPTAEKYLRRAAVVLGPDPHALPDPAERAGFAQTIGDVLVQRGDLAEAETWFGRLEERGRAEERPEWVVRGMERRARVAWYRGDLPESARLYEAGLRDLPEGEAGLAADLHNGLGVVHHYQGLPELAFDHISRALKLREGGGDRLGMAKCLLNMGSVFLDLQEDLDSAERYYRDAYEAAESIGDRQMRYSALNNLGRVATERGEWTEALETLDRAERILEEIGWSFARYVTLQNRADCEIALGRLGDAIRHLRICRDRGDTVLGPVNRVTTRIFLFDAWYRMLADDRAAEWLVEARAVVDETARPEEIHEILLREGRLLAAADRWEEAVEVFARAEAEARQHAAPTQLALAAAHRRRAMIRAGRPDPGRQAGADVRSLPYATLLLWLEADAEAALEPGSRSVEMLGRVVEQAARMGIVSLERAAAERLAGVHAAQGDAAAAALALSRAVRAMLVLAENLPPERRDAFLEHPRNAQLVARVEPADRAGTAP